MKRLVYIPLFLLAAPAARAEYLVLRSGQRLHVLSYQLVDDKYRAQLNVGSVEFPAAEVVSIEPEDTFAPLPPVEPSKEPFGDLIQAAALRYSVDADLITSVIAAESNFDSKAVSRKDARGLMQLLPTTAAKFGVRNIFDPAENIDAGTRYLRDLLQRYSNDLVLTLAAYNAGPERVQQYGQVPPFMETISYIRRVRETYTKRKSGNVAKDAPSKPAPKTNSLVAAASPSGR
jgi:soluble lytic murein transglycosylase-like protein